MSEVAHSFRAMNTTVRALIASDELQAAEALHQVEHLFERVESSLSRFRPDSELSRLNRSTSLPARVSPLLFEVVAEAVSWARATDGMFDPRY